MIMHKLIYKIGERLRNKHIQPHLANLLKSDKYTIEELEKIQIIQLKKLFYIAKENSTYYKDILSPYDIDSFTLNDLKKLPVLTRDFLRNNLNDLYTVEDKLNLIKAETSGSSGNALFFYKNKEWDASARAAQQRGYSWYGIRPWDKNIYFWGFNPSWKQLIKIRFLDFLMNRYRIFSFSESEFKKSVKVIKKLKYIEGYSSIIFSLSQYLKKNNYTFKNIKLVKGTSEKIYDYYKLTIQKVFNKNFTNEYGAAETGVIAFECPEGNMHITMENVIVEEIGNKIYVTNLYSYSLPIIRYELGDYILLDKKTKCKCGREHYIIKEVTGRIGKKIYGIESFYPTITLNYIFKNIALSHDIALAYFGKQYEKGKLILEIIEEETYSKENISKYIYNESEKYFKSDMAIEIKFLKSIESNNKKVKDFESYIKESVL